MTLRPLLEALRSPSGRMVRHWTLLCAIAVGTPLLAFALSKTTPLVATDWTLYDLRVSHLAPRIERDHDIVIVAIDEKTLSSLPFDSPVERRFLAGLLRKIETGKPAAIGLDILLDRPTFPDADDALRDGFMQLRTPIVGIVPVDANAATHSIYDIALGTPHLLSNENIVRSMTMDRLPHAPDALPFAVALADAAGRSVDKTPRSGLIAFNLTASGGFPFVMISAADLMTLDDLPWLKDKIVLVGRVAPFQDRHGTPLRFAAGGEISKVPGVVIQAYQLAQLLEGKTIHTLSGGMTFLLILFLSVLGGGIAFIFLRTLTILSLVVVGAIVWLVTAFWAFGATNVILPVSGPLIGFSASAMLVLAAARFGLASTLENARRNLQLLMNTGVAQEVLSTRLGRHTVRCDLTSLFTDVEQFTRFVEATPPDISTQVINGYFDEILAVVESHGGTVDYLVGDAVHVLFVGPAHASAAVACALDLKSVTDAYREKVQATAPSFGRTRIGVHTGPAWMGYFGGKSRVVHTAHGTTINLAHRLEQANKHLGSQICVSSDVRDAAADFEYVALGSTQLPGLQDPMEVFEPIETKDR